jgi:hypothetical protein
MQPYGACCTTMDQNHKRTSKNIHAKVPRKEKNVIRQMEWIQY